MAKVYSIEPVSFGFRPATECLEQDGKEGVYLRFRYGLIERLSVSSVHRFTVCYEAHCSPNGGGYSFKSVLDRDGILGTRNSAEILLSILQITAKRR